ncbi:MAG: 5-oxoprolinase subunit PxpA [Brumimicrobium sp.]
MDSNKTIDINADLGEGAGQDFKIMPLISSCNIACGGHAGDKESMNETIDLAQKNQVKVGAHPSYPDKENFGRVELQMRKIDLIDSLQRQISTFYELALAKNTTVHHIKAHGALYNKLAHDESTAEVFLTAISRLAIHPILYVPFNSVVYHLAKVKFHCKVEAFIDRAYNKDLSLVSRDNPEGLLKTPKKAWEQLYGMIMLGEVTTIQNDKIALEGETFCIHGDHPNAVEILNYIHRKLEIHQINLK